MGHRSGMNRPEIAGQRLAQLLNLTKYLHVRCPVIVHSALAGLRGRPERYCLKKRRTFSSFGPDLRASPSSTGAFAGANMQRR